MSLDRPTVVELRQYTLHGGRRDELIRLFQQEFLAPQIAVGAEVMGRYRDLDDADRFVWLRGFADMPSRQSALQAFYGGEVWSRYRNAANATIVDSDNVLLLKPRTSADAATLSRIGANADAVVRVAIHYLEADAVEPFSEYFTAHYLSRAATGGAHRIASLSSETSANNFPRLPVRDHEHVFVWFAEFADERQVALFNRNLAAFSGWRDAAPETLLPSVMRKPEILRLRR
jgi:NIPSNAP